MECPSLILSLLAVLLGVYYFIFKTRNVFKEHGVPYVAPKLIVGNMGPLTFKKVSMPQLLQRFYDLNPDAKYVGMYDFSSAVLILRDIELIKSVCTKNFDCFQDHRVFIDKDVDPLFGNSMFFLKGEKWRDMRSMVTPSFTSSKMKTMFVLMTSCAIDFADHVAKLPASEREIELKGLVSKYANDVIASCALGVTVDTKKEPNNALYVYGKQVTRGEDKSMGFLFSVLLYRHSPALAKLMGCKLMNKKIEDFYYDIVSSTVKTRDEQGISRPDMMQLMMDGRKKTESGRGLTVDDITVLAFTFFFGGFESVSSQICFILYHLAINPNVQEKLYEEINEVLENTEGKVSYDTIMSMEYLDAVVNETLRINPASSFLDRLCVKSFELPPALPGGKPFTVEPGANLWIPVYSIHNDPNYFRDPEKFDPERFLVDGKRIMNSGTFLPFGIGPRMCIGNRFALCNMKVLIFHLLSRCEFKRYSKTEVPLELSKELLSVTAQNGYWVKMEPRKNPCSVLQGSYDQ